MSLTRYVALGNYYVLRLILFLRLAEKGYAKVKQSYLVAQKGDSKGMAVALKFRFERVRG